MAPVVLDSSIVVALLNHRDVLHKSAYTAVTDWEAKRSAFLLPAVVWTEVLTGVLRSKASYESALIAFRTRTVDEIVPIDEAIADSAARLRAVHRGLRTPDALVIATAAERRAAALLTGDGRLRGVAPDLVRLIRA